MVCQQVRYVKIKCCHFIGEENDFKVYGFSEKKQLFGIAEKKITLDNLRIVPIQNYNY
jgi:hypothetical protein